MRSWWLACGHPHRPAGALPWTSGGRREGRVPQERGPSGRGARWLPRPPPRDLRRPPHTEGCRLLLRCDQSHMPEVRAQTPRANLCPRPGRSCGPQVRKNRTACSAWNPSARPCRSRPASKAWAVAPGNSGRPAALQRLRGNGVRALGPVLYAAASRISQRCDLIR